MSLPTLNLQRNTMRHRQDFQLLKRNVPFAMLTKSKLLAKLAVPILNDVVWS
jgi:hypothetical protein